MVRAAHHRQPCAFDSDCPKRFGHPVCLDLSERGVGLAHDRATGVSFEGDDTPRGCLLPTWGTQERGRAERRVPRERNLGSRHEDTHRVGPAGDGYGRKCRLAQVDLAGDERHERLIALVEHDAQRIAGKAPVAEDIDDAVPHRLSIPRSAFMSLVSVGPFGSSRPGLTGGAVWLRGWEPPPYPSPGGRGRGAGGARPHGAGPPPANKAPVGPWGPSPVPPAP